MMQDKGDLTKPGIAETCSECTNKPSFGKSEPEVTTNPSENPSKCMMQGEGNLTNTDTMETSREVTNKPPFGQPEHDKIKEATTNLSENPSSNEDVDAVNTEEKCNEKSSTENNSGEQCEKMEENRFEVNQSGPIPERSSSNCKSKAEKNQADKNRKKDRENVKKDKTNVSKNRGNDSKSDQHFPKEDKGNKRKNRFGNKNENADTFRLRANADCTDEFVFFWRSDSPYSQWYIVNFTVDGQEFNCAEQYMMYGKAMLFGDEETAHQVLQETDPRNHKWLGRRVQNFVQKKWDANCLDIVKRGNKAKFSQNKDLCNIILNSNPKTLVEASPQDKIWGIGLSSDDFRARDRKKWRGKNLLGQALTEVRDEFIRERQGLTKEDVQGEIRNKTDDSTSTAETQKGSMGVFNIPETEEVTTEDITNEDTTKKPTAKNNTDDAEVVTTEHSIDKDTTEECTAKTSTVESIEGTIENSTNEDTSKEPTAKNNTEDPEVVTTEHSIDQDTIEECTAKTSTVESIDGTTENSTNEDTSKEPTAKNNTEDPEVVTTEHSIDKDTTEECTAKTSTVKSKDGTTENSTNEDTTKEPTAKNDTEDPEVVTTEHNTDG